MIRNPLIPAGSSVPVASTKTVIAATGQTAGRDTIYFAATNSDGSQTFNGNVEVSADNSNWYVTNYSGLKAIGPGQGVGVRVDVFGHPYARITGTASGAGLTLTNAYCEMQDKRP